MPQGCIEQDGLDAIPKTTWANLSVTTLRSGLLTSSTKGTPIFLCNWHHKECLLYVWVTAARKSWNRRRMSSIFCPNDQHTSRVVQGGSLTYSRGIIYTICIFVVGLSSRFTAWVSPSHRSVTRWLDYLHYAILDLLSYDQVILVQYVRSLFESPQMIEQSTLVVSRLSGSGSFHGSWTEYRPFLSSIVLMNLS